MSSDELPEKELDVGVGKCLNTATPCRYLHALPLPSQILAIHGEVRYRKKINHGSRSAGPGPLSHSLYAACCQSKHGGCYCRGQLHAVKKVYPSAGTVSKKNKHGEEHSLPHTSSENTRPHIHTRASVHLASADRELPGIHFHRA